MQRNLLALHNHREQQTTQRQTSNTDIQYRKDTLCRGYLDRVVCNLAIYTANILR